jgi:site-specific recombinase XerD
MRRHRPLHHPLEPFFERSAESLTTALSDASVRGYHATFRGFLRYLSAHHPEICRLAQVRRDPHVLGWLAELRSHTPPLARISLATRVVYLHRLLEELAWTEQIPTLTRLLSREDVPRRERTLPRPLLPEQDQRIQQELIRRDDLASNLLLLQRHTGMRIGECVDLAADCLRPLGPDQWAIHVPLGKLKTERLVPVDSFVCQIIGRLHSLRSQSDSEPGCFLLPRLRGRETLIRGLRAAFRDVVAAAGITTRLVPHQNRHTYATEMLRAGVSLTGVMELLGHASPEMTLLYLEITQPDLQREYHLARSHPRHLVPSPRAPLSSASSRADLPSLLDSLDAARHILEMFRRDLSDDSARRLLDRLGNRLSKIVAQLRHLGPAEE